MSDLPSDFDWVTARANCSAVGLFERLRLLSERDVETRNKIRTDPNHEDLQFTVGGSGSTFTVLRGHVPGHRVAFRLKGMTTLHVVGDRTIQPLVDFTGTITLTNDAKCRLRVDDEELDEWQVLRKALEPLFFPE